MMDTLLTQLPEELEREIRQMVWHCRMNDSLRYLKVLNTDYYWDTDWERTYWKPKRLFSRMETLKYQLGLENVKTIDDIEKWQENDLRVALREEYDECLEELLERF
jgi:hypothetical protein